MITKTTKILLFAVIFTGLIIPLSIASQVADAESTPVVDDKRELLSQYHQEGQQTIDDIFAIMQENEPLKKLQEKGETLSEAQIQKLEDADKKIDDLTTSVVALEGKIAKLHTMSPEMEKQYRVAQTQIVESDLPFSRIIVNTMNESLDIRLFEDNGLDYDSQIKAIIGDGINYRLDFGGGIDPDACDTQTSDCNPMIGGINSWGTHDSGPNPDVTGNCTITIGGVSQTVGVTTTDGFVTAGHCYEHGSDVKQPDSGNTVVGEVTQRVVTGTCDCEFIEETGTETSEQAFWSGFQSQLDFNGRTDPVVTHSILMTGVESGFEFGTVDFVNEPVSLYGNTITGVVVVSGFTSADGDSGGTMVKGTDFKKFQGLVSGHDNITGETYVIKQSAIWDNLDLD